MAEIDLRELCGISTYLLLVNVVRKFIEAVHVRCCVCLALLINQHVGIGLCASCSGIYLYFMPAVEAVLQRSHTIPYSERYSGVTMSCQMTAWTRYVATNITVDILTFYLLFVNVINAVKSMLIKFCYVL